MVRWKVDVTRTVWETVVTYCIVPLALLPDGLVQVLLAPVAEALDGLGDATQRAVDLLWVHVLRVVLHHATRRTNTERNTHQMYMRCISGEDTQAWICLVIMQRALAFHRLVFRKGEVSCENIWLSVFFISTHQNISHTLATIQSD